MMRQNIIPQILIYCLGTQKLTINKVLNTNSILGVWKYGREREMKQEMSAISFTRICLPR